MYIIQDKSKICKKIKNFFNRFKSLSEAIVQKFCVTVDSLEDKTCPCCKREHGLIGHGFYTRSVRIFFKGKKYKFPLKIQRVCCNGCGKTHALLPVFVVPYKQISLDTFLKIVEEYFNSHITDKAELMEQLCEKYGISERHLQNLLAWLKDFFYNFKILNNEFEFVKSSLGFLAFLKYCVNGLGTAFLEKYNTKFNTFFLMTKFRNCNSCPVYTFFKI